MLTFALQHPSHSRSSNVPPSANCSQRHGAACTNTVNSSIEMNKVPTLLHSYSGFTHKDRSEELLHTTLPSDRQNKYFPEETSQMVTKHLLPTENKNHINVAVYLNAVLVVLCTTFKVS